MSRPVTIFTGQWADLPLVELAKKMGEFGYNGLELACWGDHFDVFQGAKSKAYCNKIRKILADNGLNCWAISNHLAGQLTLDPDDDERTDGFGALPEYCNGNADLKRDWAIKSMKASAKAAANLGVKVVNGFTGSPIWHLLYSFPPVPQKTIDRGYEWFAEIWNPILDEFDKYGVRFALEVHPTELAFDLYSAQRILEAIDHRPAFGFNFDPSHLIWQGVDPVEFLRAFPDRIYHVHVKDAQVTLDGRTGILSSHINFGEPHRGWDFRSPGHGDANYEEIIRELNRIGYNGPLSVEWEDSGMDRDYGAQDALDFVHRVDFPASQTAFDAAFNH